MNEYILDIKIALIIFPFVALFIAIPFILIEYHKYGSVSFLKSLLVYSFVLYLICAYFLIIMPLPKKSAVALLTTPRVQLIPFEFVIDIIKHFSFSTSFFTSSYIYVPLYNIALMIPFGMYLTYFFKCDFKKTMIYTFLLSFFFELTQLSGLYFIYPRGYRLCDIDDLMLNTLGGILGYYLIGIIIKKLPTMEKIKQHSLEKGTEITGFKRTTSVILDIFICLLLVFISLTIKDNKYVMCLIIFIYYIIIPYITKGSTLGQKFLNLKIVYKNKFNIFFLVLRIILFLSIYFAFPYYLYLLCQTNDIICFILFGFVIIFYVSTGIKYIFTSKPLIYEKLSKTNLVSTIKCE